MHGFSVYCKQNLIINSRKPLLYISIMAVECLANGVCLLCAIPPVPPAPHCSFLLLSSLSDTFQFRSQEEDCSMSREEIKRRSIQLIEVHQPKKKAQRSNTKS